MTDAGTNRPSHDAIRRLEAENDDLRRKLASHEFRQMERELAGETPFALHVHADTAPEAGGVVLPALDAVLLPRLPVPMGTIQAEPLSRDLPVIAVHDDGLTGPALAAALLGLLKTQYRAPFAHLVFLCSSFEAVPFLGRYGFVAEQIGATDPAATLARLNRRYGVSQIRSVATGEMIAEIGGD